MVIIIHSYYVLLVKLGHLSSLPVLQTRIEKAKQPQELETVAWRISVPAGGTKMFNLDENAIEMTSR